MNRFDVRWATRVLQNKINSSDKRVAEASQKILDDPELFKQFIKRRNERIKKRVENIKKD